MTFQLKFLKHLIKKSKKIVKALPVILLGGIFGGVLIALLAIFLRKKRKGNLKNSDDKSLTK
ncbi:MAG: hypothetical protein AB1465_06775 [Patescibacteria group bacterium]